MHFYLKLAKLILLLIVWKNETLLLKADKIREFIEETFFKFSKCLKLFKECGKANSLSLRRIVNGTETAPHKYPWMAAMFVYRTFFCGGSVISAKHLLTTGHCMNKYIFQTVYKENF